MNASVGGVRASATRAVRVRTLFSARRIHNTTKRQLLSGEFMGADLNIPRVPEPQHGQPATSCPRSIRYFPHRIFLRSLFAPDRSRTALFYLCRTVGGKDASVVAPFAFPHDWSQRPAGDCVVPGHKCSPGDAGTGVCPTRVSLQQSFLWYSLYASLMNDAKIQQEQLLCDRSPCPSDLRLVLYTAI